MMKKGIEERRAKEAAAAAAAAADENSSDVANKKVRDGHGFGV